MQRMKTDEEILQPVTAARLMYLTLCSSKDMNAMRSAVLEARQKELTPEEFYCYLQNIFSGLAGMAMGQLSVVSGARGVPSLDERSALLQEVCDRLCSAYAAEARRQSEGGK